MRLHTFRYFLAACLLGMGALLLFAHDEGNAPHGGRPPLHVIETMKAFQDDHHEPEPLAAQSITNCVGGFAGIYPCNNVDLMAFLPLNQIGGGSGNDIWGWTDSTTGKEYAIMGRTNGTSFVDVSDPVNPIYLGTLLLHGTTANSNWRDIKVFNNHAFVVSEANNSGMQIFDLTLLRSGPSPTGTYTETAWYNGFLRAHNLVINEDSGFAYAVGSNVCAGGLEIVDINNPLVPIDTGCFSGDGYTHDAQCVNYVGPDTDHTGAEVCLASNTDTLTIVDVTNKAATSQISRSGYAGRGYTHQGWLTDDHRYFLLDDELDERDFGHNTRTYIWDVSDLDNPILLGNYTGTSTAYDHNQYIKGNLSYQSNYRSGLRILDISGIAAASLNEVAFFDVYPANDANGFNGTWSNYPYFDSGIVVVSGIEQGLFVLKPNLGGGSNPPTASIVAPVAASTVSGNELVQIDASDDVDPVGSLTVEWNVDGGPWQPATLNGAYYEANWDTTATPNGGVTLNARAIDSDLGVANASANVNVSNALSAFHIASIDVVSQAENGRRARGVATVTVHDSGGAGVSGVAISGTFSLDWSGLRDGLTDSNGVVVVQSPPVKNGSEWMYCVDSAVKAGWTYDDAGGPDCGSNVGPATFGTVDGVISDSGTAAPIVGATVSADSGQSDTTDAGGAYSLTSVPTGTRTISASAGGYATKQANAGVTDGGTAVVDLALDPSGTGGGVGTIRGTVHNSGGAKLGGVLVETDTGHSALTNNGGKYTIQNVPEGERTVTASKSGYTSGVANATVSAASTTTLNFTLAP